MMISIAVVAGKLTPSKVSKGQHQWNAVTDIRMNGVCVSIRAGDHYRFSGSDPGRTENSVDIFSGEGFSSSKGIIQSEILGVGLQADLPHLGQQPGIWHSGFVVLPLSFQFLAPGFGQNNSFSFYLRISES